MNTSALATEQEASVCILFACVLNKSQGLTQSRIEQLSRMLVLSSRFRDTSLNELTVKALSLNSEEGSKAIIEQYAPLISDDFKETLFAMCCELLTDDGKINDEESEILAMTALYLGLTVENMRMMLTTYLIRNRWNVQIVEQ